MENSTLVLAGTAMAIAFIHTAAGPDHYVPFIALGEAGKWTIRKTMVVTFLCGLGHVLSSIALGILGIVAGAGISKIAHIESFRGELAAWLLIAFGIVYALASLRNAYKEKKHSHEHGHPDGTTHEHEHGHSNGHAHPHVESRKPLTPWVLFIIFVLGPCEPLIPLVMLPAAGSDRAGVALVCAAFAAVTIGTMMAIVMASRIGLRFIRPRLSFHHMNALAGATICASGLAIRFLGL
jgi:ABC-type nickel/cobalt efflux system permease component RcnA